MKKGIIKKFVPLVMVGVVAVASALSLSGCYYKTRGVAHFVIADDEYIIYNGVLHKGDVVSEGAMFSDITSPVPEIKCDCGLERGTTIFVKSKQKPAQDEYDSVCEQCFN